MKSPSLPQFFLFWLTLHFFNGVPVVGQVVSYPYTQGFEGTFTTGKEVEFLPLWWGNEVSSGSSRIFKSGAEEARSGSAALAVVPTGSFTGDTRLQLDASSLEGGEILFWARSVRNGSGSRPALLTVSFSTDNGSSFSKPIPIGGTEAFPNENTPYQPYQLSLPDEVLGQSNVVLRLQVRKGSGGEGTAAGVLIDDFNLTSHPSAFRLLSVEPLNPHQVELLFNKNLRKSSAENESYYQISGGIQVKEAVVDGTNGRRVLLSTSKLEEGSSYTLQLGKVLDEEGNSAEGQERSFVWNDHYEIKIYDLLISEVHPAPNEHTLLPNLEWVEVYNASGRTLQLEGITFADESRSVVLPAYSLPAGSYLALAPAADARQLEQFGAVLGLSSWPSLNNDGDVISLYSKENKLLDRIGYSKSWYGSSQKAQGGWSLERIDLANPCVGASNWLASEAPVGGTPAKANSIATANPDLGGPELLLAYVLDSLTIQLVFNEPLDTTGLNAGIIEIIPEVPIQKVRSLPDAPQKLLLELSRPLSRQEDYQLSLSNLTDCSGNFMEPAHSVEVGYPRKAGEKDVVINEVMYDPPLNSEEWVEIANVTDHYLDLQNWQLVTFSNGIKASTVISREHLIVPPKGLLVFTPQPEGIKAAFPQTPERKLHQLSAMPGLVNTGDTIGLINSEGTVVDRFGYHKELHSSFVRETKGISLERINMNAPTNAPGNWTSAAATANFGTPGLPNSQRFQGEEGQDVLFSIEPEVIIPGSAAPTGYATIRYNTDLTGLQATLIIFDTEGREVKRLAQNELIGTENFFSWDGTGEGETRLKMGYYIVFLRVFGSNGYKREFRKAIVVGR